MAQIKGKTPINFNTNDGIQSLNNYVLDVNTISYNKGDDNVIVTCLVYKSEQSEINKGVQLFQEPNQALKTEMLPKKDEQGNIIYDEFGNTILIEAITEYIPSLNTIEIPKDFYLKNSNPILIYTLESKGLECIDLILLNTPWAEFDNEGNPIDLEVRKTRVFTTWEQGTKFADNYLSLVQGLKANNVPAKDDVHGRIYYFEYIDDPRNEETPIENLLISILGNKNIQKR